MIPKVKEVTGTLDGEFVQAILSALAKGPSRLLTTITNEKYLSSINFLYEHNKRKESLLIRISELICHFNSKGSDLKKHIVKKKIISPTLSKVSFLKRHSSNYLITSLHLRPETTYAKDLMNIYGEM